MLAQPAIDTRLRPLEALRATKILIATGDTRQVFVIFRAMRGRSAARNFRRFEKTALGQAVFKDRRDLLSTLNDREGLNRLPPGTLGRAYLDFMEAERLSAQGLVEASQHWDDDPVPPDVELFRRRLREMHDLLHTVTNYGRDQLGELCLLTFVYRQQGNLGMLMIVAMAWSRLPAQARKAVREAWRNGRKARWLAAENWEALLARPLEEVRHDLSIHLPRFYQPLNV
ncbi:MAG TPA: Coq4 family protein [Rhizomicrobium sp.]|nr:Coq4 family protein [Rhizomicrobium sp.]